MGARQGGGGEGAAGRGEVTKGSGRRAACPDTQLRERSWGHRKEGRTRPSTGTIRLADQAGAARCCGCGVCAAGAAAPRRFTTSGLGCVRLAPRFAPASIADLVLSGPSRKLGVRNLCWLPAAWPCPHPGDIPRGYTLVSARLWPQWPSAQGMPPSSAASLSLQGACGPEWMEVTRTSFSKKVLLAFIVFCGHRIGHACGVDGRRGRMGI